MKISEVIEINKEDSKEIEIRINRPATSSPYEAMHEELYSGILADVPAELFDEEVQSIGQSMKALEEGKTVHVIQLYAK